MTHERMDWNFSHLGYYFILLLVLLWIWFLIQMLRNAGFSARGFLRRHAVGILVSAGLTTAVFASVRPALRILSDETNLLAVSQSMLTDRTTYNATMAKRYYGAMHFIQRDVPARPLAFPFFTYLVHLVRGYHVENVFILNGLVLFSLLVLSFVFTRRYIPDLATPTAAVFLIVASPLVSVMATSGSYDLFATLFFFVSALALLEFVREPSSEDSLGFLVTSVLIFSYVRNESVVILPIVIAGIFVFRYVTLSRIMPWMITITIFAQPILWQRILMQGHYENPPDVPLLSLAHLPNNFPALLHTFIDHRFMLPLATLLHDFAVVIFVFAIVLLITKRVAWRAPYQKHFVLIIGLSFAATMGVYLCHFFGDMRLPTQIRWLLILAVLSSLSPVFLRILRPHLIGGRVLLVVSIALFLIYHPVAIGNELLKTLTLPRAAVHQYEFLSHRSHPENLLVIADRPGQLSAADYGAIGIQYANKHVTQLGSDLTRSLYSEVVVFQDCDYATDGPVENQALDARFTLETLERVQTDGGRYLRISRVLSVGPEAD